MSESSGWLAVDEVADGVEQVRLAQADAAVDEERVVGLGGRLGHGQRGRLGEAVGRPGDEGLEGEPGLQAARAPRLERGHALARRGGGEGLLLGGLGRRLAGLDRDLDLQIRPADLEEGVAQERQVALADPLAQELGVDREHDAVVGEHHRPGSREGELERLAVERGAQALADLRPDGVALVGGGDWWGALTGLRRWGGIDLRGLAGRESAGRSEEGGDERRRRRR